MQQPKNRSQRPPASQTPVCNLLQHRLVRSITWINVRSQQKGLRELAMAQDDIAKDEEGRDPGRRALGCDAFELLFVWLGENECECAGRRVRSFYLSGAREILWDLRIEEHFAFGVAEVSLPSRRHGDS